MSEPDKGGRTKIPFFSSVRVRLVLAVVFMVAIPFAILQIANVFLIYNKLHVKTAYTTKALSHSIATNLTEFMQGVFDCAGLLAQNESVGEGGPAGQALLEDIVKRMPYFDLIYVQGMNGMQTIRSSGKLMNRSDRWWFKRMAADPTPFVSEAYISVNQNELVASVFQPMVSDGSLSGILGADFTLDTIQDAMALYLNEDISFIVLDSKGSVLAGTGLITGEYVNYVDYTKRTVLLSGDGKYILDAAGNIITTVEKITVSDTMKRIISGALESKTESFNFRDERNDIIVCSYQPVRLPGKSEPWSVIVFQRETDNLSVVLLIGLFTLLILCCIPITYSLIRSGILKPVLDIQADMSAIASGRLDVRLDESKRNEIGLLAGDINRMNDALKKQQQKIDEDEKMVALGNLVAGVAHEINTPLGIGVTTASYMSKINDDCRLALSEGRLTKDDLIEYMESMDESLALLQNNLERGSGIIQSFKQIAVDLSHEAREEFNVLQYINNVVLSLTHEYKRGGHTFRILCDESLRISSYPGVFAQILTNFIMNSIIHGFNGRQNGHIEISAFLESGCFVLRYADDGCGIRAENLDKVFEPFFTTRKGSGGSGLGLNIVRNLVVKKLMGTVRVESEPGNGTIFTVSIPIGEG